MGWGRKTVAAPVPQPAVLGPSEGHAAAMRRAKPKAEVEVEEPLPDDVTSAAKAEIEWLHFRASKGWLPELTNTVMHEFLKQEELFAKLLKYARKRR